MTSRTYADAIEALNSLQTNFSIIDAIRKSGGKSNKDAIPQMLEWARRSGYPDPKAFDKLNIIHVTGTKGKGSTCAFVQSILNQYRVESPSIGEHGISKIGLYTSPHLKSVRERIRINGEPIAEEKFVKYFFELWDQLESTSSNEADFPDMIAGVKPVYFRYLTLLSFHIFLHEGVDTAIYEVGIGGEYDSTNIIVSPTATGVSSLGLDHTNILGNTIEEIAWNKSGIFKKGTPALTIPQPEGGDAMKVLKERALEKAGRELTVVPVHPLIANGTAKLGLAGEFQKTNASLAVGLVTEHLRKLNIDSDNLATANSLPPKFLAGLEAASWPGRCQTLKQGTITYSIDGAHTQESITEAGKWYVSRVKDENQSNPPAHRVLLFNQQNRDANALVTTLHTVLSKDNVKFDHVIFTTNVTRKTGYSADLTSLNTSKEAVDELVVQNALSSAWEKIDTTAQRHVFSNIEESVNFIKSLGGETSVLVTGSLILVGGFLAVVEDN
ncbi:tetrahydrofolate synthase [Sugiyamaella lignohabitans]|uniref:Folylpolyglutamate synthase n=1 Tax=Sugiyamaella lignohabitans TaxID=796027 RepID=A0A167CK84_9ASCO|nr:tetrahydrofolate synthase [Sugiyamaella lignohabitans]ANB11804.1 tetrahydrofolate synthase [Sugiyamaella lignohabitans]